MLTIGILGGGQLARMLALAAYPLGLRTICLDPAIEASAADVTPVIRADYTDETALRDFAELVDVITVENENLPVDQLTWLNTLRPVAPNSDAIAYAQDRLLEKKLFQELNIPTTEFYMVDRFEDLQQACVTLGFPAVLKTRRFGYDGKGQYVIRTADDIAPAWESLKNHALILESWVKFDREVSLIAVRDAQNQIKFYPLVENIHQAGILHISRAPFVHAELFQLAQGYLRHLLEKLNYIGVLTVEFFACGETLIANEMAPRVHNSGHWTIEGAVTSQFANHIRAVAGLPLGDTAARGYSAMLNCVGNEPDLAAVLEYPNAYYHRYNKTAKPQRKLAHITVNTSTIEEREKQLTGLLKLL